jgi:endogenous inhibitor of DNA gyrase (YacG/DUF329 family)
MDQVLRVGAKRRCDQCPKFYIVQTKHNRFCSKRCRDDFHRFGSPYLRLRPKIAEEAKMAASEIEMRIFAVMDQPTRNRYATLYPARARQFEEQLRD